MDKIVSAAQALPASPSEKELKDLRGLLTREESNIAKNLASIDDILANLVHPHNHAMVYVYLLAAKAAHVKTDASKFVQQFQNLTKDLNVPQIRLCQFKFGFVCRRFVDIAIEKNIALGAVRPFRMLIARLRDGSEMLTPQHVHLLHLCLASKCYHGALDTLQEEIYDVTSDRNTISVRDVLLYYYYGGLIFTAIKRFPHALHFFGTALSVPANAPSAIMVEALKKYQLISLLLFGKVIAVPKHTSSALTRSSKHFLQPYTDFANAFNTGNAEDINKAIDKSKDIFKKDGNLGLIKQCQVAFIRRKIQRLTQTYLTLSLKELAVDVKLSTTEAEHIILGMIERGEIFAVINQKDGTVSFHERPESFDTAAVAALIDRHLQNVIDISNKVRHNIDEISTDPSYISKTMEKLNKSFGDGPMDDLAEASSDIKSSNKMM